MEILNGSQEQKNNFISKKIWMETQAIQDLEVVNQLSAEDKVLVVTKDGEVVLAKKELFKSEGGATPPSGNGVKKYATDEEANAETHEEYDLAVIWWELKILKNGKWEVIKTITPQEIKKASPTEAGVVKIAKKSDIDAMRNTDDDGCFLLPKMTDVFPSFLGTKMLAGNTLAPNNSVYIHSSPKLEKANKELVFGKDEVTKYLDIQSVASGEPLKEFALKLKKYGLPTTDIPVEIYRGQKTETYFKPEWEVLTTTKLSWKQIENEGKYVFHTEKTLELEAWTPLVFRLQMQDGIVNAQNYYAVFADEENFSDVYCSAYRDTQNTNGVYLESDGLEKQVIKRTLNGTYKFWDKFKKKWQRVWNLFAQNLAFPEIDPNKPIIAKVKAHFHTTFDYQWSIGEGETIPGEIEIFGEYGTITDYRTHDISFTKQVTLEQLRNFHIRRIIENHHSSLNNPVTEVEYSIELTFKEKNSALEGQPLYVRNEAQRFGAVTCTVLGLHIDGTFIYPKADGAALVMKGIPWPEGKRIEIRVKDKTFQYRYQGEENWYDIWGAIDFVWPPWPTGPEGKRGRMWGINYRGQKASLSDLPAQASIEWEAYSIGNDIYIWDGEKFARGLDAVGITLVSENESLINSIEELKNELKEYKDDIPRKFISETSINRWNNAVPIPKNCRRILIFFEANIFSSLQPPADQFKNLAADIYLDEKKIMGRTGYKTPQGYSISLTFNADFTEKKIDILYWDVNGIVKNTTIKFYFYT